MGPTLLVSACDAGSANFLAPVLPRLCRPWRAVAEGPAARIFAQRGIPFSPAPDSGPGGLAARGSAILAGHGDRAVLAGTSWGSTVDKAVTLAARAAGLPSAAVVEHWGLYRERFSRVEAGRIVEADIFLPDQVWVVDGDAAAEAVRAGLPAGRLRQVGQPHLEDQRRRLAAAVPPRRDDSVVFVSERLAGDQVGLGFDEYQALAGVAAALPPGRRLVIKLHPQEAADKYDGVLAATGIEATVIGQCDIPPLILGAGRVVGMVSMLLLEAALARGDVISFMPGGRADDFVGNRIGATRPATEGTTLARLLAAPAEAESGPPPFADRFEGSLDRVLAAIEELMTCA